MKLRSLLRTLVDPGWEQARRRRSPVAAVEVGPLVVRRLEERRVLVAPIITTSPGATVFAENGPAVQVDPAVTAFDLDLTLASVTVTIDDYTGPAEELQFTNTANITGSWDSNTGVLTFTGPALFTEYTTALQSVHYLNTSDAPPLTQSITFEANDGLLLSIPGTKNISITRNADTPTVTNSTTDEDTMTSSGLVITTDPNDGANFYQISNITGGTLFKSDGATQINDGAFITLGEGAAGLRFLPSGNSFTDPNDVTPFEGRFDAQASTTNNNSGLGGSVVTATITVSAVADTPNVPNATTNEDETATILITPNAVDSTSVTHFQITNITNGTLYLNDDATAVNDGDFVSVTEAALGLKFRPTPDYFTVTSPLDPATLGSFDVQAVLFGTTPSGPIVQSQITINPVADTPSITSPMVNEDEDAIIDILPNAIDGSSVTHIKVTAITAGQLYLSDGVTLLSAGDFIAVADATGLIFRMAANQSGPGTVNARASTTGDDSGLGGPVVTSNITVLSMPDDPRVNAPASINEDTIAPISIQRSAVDGADVTHFRISNVRHGTLYRDAGRTQPAIIGANLTEALVLSLFFSPDANYFSDPLNPTTFAGFDVQGSTAGGTLGSVVTVSMPVNPVAESPDIPNATMFEDGGRVGIPVEPDPVDGPSVTHFKITRIDSGTLRAGAAVLSVGDFITVAQGLTLNFEPAADFNGTAEVRLQAAVDSIGTGLSPEVTSTITVASVPDGPIVTAPAAIDEDSTAAISIQRNAVDGPDVTHFRITNIFNGDLFKDAALTDRVADGDIIDEFEAASLFFQPDANYYSDPLDPATFARFDVQGSIGNLGDRLGSTVTTSIIVNAVADTPTVPNATTDEDQTVTIVITPNAVDLASVTHFQITNIFNGRLFLNNEVTEILSGDFVSVADAAAGLKFRPTPNHFTVTSPLDPATLGSFDVQAVLFGTTPSGPVVQSQITINPVADTPSINSPTVNEDNDAIINIEPDPIDGPSVTHIKITSISGGQLFLADGTTSVSENDFIAVVDGTGLIFRMGANQSGFGTVDARGSTTGDDSGLSGPTVTSTITVLSVPDDPIVTAPASVDEDTTASISIQRSAVDGADVSHFRITNILHGALYHDAALTQQVNNGNVITDSEAASLFFQPDINYFSDPLDPATFARFDVQGSIGAGGTLGSLLTVSISVNRVADTPQTTNTTIDEDSGPVAIPVTPDPVDGPSVTHFQITAVSNGTLRAGAAIVNVGDFITVAQGLTLNFEPAADFNGTAEVRLQAAVDSIGTGLSPEVTSTITVASVPDGPIVTAPAAIDEDSTAAISIQRNAVDGPDVTHFRISNIQNGTLYRDAGLTLQVLDGDIIDEFEAASLFFQPDQNYFSDPLDPATFARFDVQGSIGAGGTLGSTVTTSIIINAVADTPTVPNATTDEDQTVTIVVTPNAVDLASVTHFQITNIFNGRLFLNNEVTEILSGDFVSIGETAAGLKFRPTPNHFTVSSPLDPATLGSFDVQAVLFGTTPSGPIVQSQITVNPVADTPSINSPTVNEDQDAIIDIVPNAIDGPSVTHFKITSISGGQLFLADGTTLVGENDFIAVADATGLIFRMAPNQFGPGLVDGQGSTSGDDSGLGGPTVRSNITVLSVPDDPIVAAPAAIDEDTTAAISNQRSAVDGPDVTHFRISNIQNGTLYRNAGLTLQVIDGDIIDEFEAASLFFRPTQDYFSDPLDPATFARFDVQGSIGDLGDRLGSTVTTSIIVNAVADTPTVPNATTDEDQTATIVIAPNAVDGASVTHFQITSITNGTLYLNDDATAVTEGDFVSVADAAAGLKFRPTADLYTVTSPLDPATLGSFDVQAVLFGTTPSGPVVQSQITINPVADTPSINSPTVDEDQDATINILPNAIDDSSVTHFKIATISGGQLFLADGTTLVSENGFIAVADATGLIFRMGADQSGVATVTAQGSTAGDDSGLSGPTVTSTITVLSVPDDPLVSAPAAIDEDTTEPISIQRGAVDAADISHFRITNIVNGQLFKDAAMTDLVTDGEFISESEASSLFFQPDTNYYSDPFDPATFARFDVQGSIGDLGDRLGSTVTTSIIVNAVADTPTVPNATTDEDQTVTIVITPNAVDGTSVTHFQITSITNGTLYLNDNAAAVTEGDFVSVADAAAGLKFRPTPNHFTVSSPLDPATLGSFDVQAVLFGTAPSGSIVQSQISINPVADTPQTTDAAMDEDEVRALIPVRPNSVDGSSVTHFQITAISSGTLRAGVVIVNQGDFITVAQGLTLNFEPESGFNGPAFIHVRAAVDAIGTGIGPEAISTVTVNNLPPSVDFGTLSEANEGQVVIITPTVSDSGGEFDPLSFSWRVFYQGALHTDGNESTIEFMAAQDGHYFIEYTVSDDDGGTKTVTDTVFVRNVSPEINSLRAQPIIRGNTAVRFRINDPGAEGVWRVKVDWGDLQLPEFHTVTTRDVVITHFYPTAPDPSAPFAPINISLSVFDGDDNSAPVQATLEVVGGLPVPVLRAPIDPPRFEFPPVRFVAERPEIDSAPELTSEVIERNRQRFNIDETKPRTFELAVVTPDGEELSSFELGQDELWDLEAFFKDNQLPDGHYRIYLVQKNTRRLLVDAYLRDGRLIDPGEETGGNFDRPPEVSEARANEDAVSRALTSETVKREAELPRDFYVYHDDRPRYDQELVADGRQTSTVGRTLVTPIDLPSSSHDPNTDEVLAVSSQHDAILIAGLATGMAGATWLVARRARKASLRATPRLHSFSKGARLLRLARRRALNWCSPSIMENRG